MLLGEAELAMGAKKKFVERCAECGGATIRGSCTMCERLLESIPGPVTTAQEPWAPETLSLTIRYGYAPTGELVADVPELPGVEPVRGSIPEDVYRQAAAATFRHLAALLDGGARAPRSVSFAER